MYIVRSALKLFKELNPDDSGFLNKVLPPFSPLRSQYVRRRIKYVRCANKSLR